VGVELVKNHFGCLSAAKAKNFTEILQDASYQNGLNQWL